MCWTDRLAPLGSPEVHLYDRESGAATAPRLRAAEIINRRPGCRAFVTDKRALENYFHPDCLREARGIDVVFGDHDDVAALVARHAWDRGDKSIRWSALPPRARRRLRDKVKVWLNNEAVMRMNLDRLADRDPAGELVSWLSTIGRLASHSAVGESTSTPSNVMRAL
jgi:hypothetical protein